MQQVVIVQKAQPDGTAQVACRRMSACSGDCHKCSGCGAAAETVVVTAENALGAQAGDLVVVESSTRTILAATAALYLVPILLFFLGYGLGLAAGFLPALLGGVGFFLGMGFAFWYDRRLAKGKTVQYKIIGYAES